MNLMLATEVFQSYYSIVSPNEAQPDPNRKVTCSVDYLESQNYQHLMKKNMKQFVGSLPGLQKNQNKRKPVVGEIFYNSDNDCFQLQVENNTESADDQWDEIV